MVKPSICNDNKKQPTVPDFCDYGDWEVPVTDLTEIKQPNRDHAYILPDNSVWVLAYDGKSFAQVTNSGENGTAQATRINNTDGYLSIHGSGTYNVTADLKTEKVIALVKEKIDIPKGTSDTVGVVKPDGQTITIDKEGTLSAVFPEAPLDGNPYIRQDGQWLKKFAYPNVYYELSNLADDQLIFNIAIKDAAKHYKVMFDNQEVLLSKLATSITGKIVFDQMSVERSQTTVEFYYIKDGVNELFYTLDLTPLFKLLNTKTSESSEYVNKSAAVTFDETEYFAIEDRYVIQQDKTVFFSVNLASIKAFPFSRNGKFKVGKLSDPELFPRIKTAVNMVTENPKSAIYANTAIIVETNGDIMLVNTSDVSIGSAYNFRVGNTHFIHMTYITG
ncbi:hypothetical protein A5881_001881 [Enterococcus termitis]|nr:hypothetical protein A5881_001799 [Enterococcus termitis]